MASAVSRMQIYILVLAAVIVTGVAGFMALEGLSLVDAFYFSIVTIATVGYGDISPATDAGKLLAVLLIVAGVGTFVGVVANGLEMYLSSREKQARLRKINMVVGVFFSMVGTPCLRDWTGRDQGIDGIRDALLVTGAWTKKEYKLAASRLARYDSGPSLSPGDLVEMRTCLEEHRDLLLRLLENPVLFEQEAFSDLLRAMFHLSEELGHRGDRLDSLPEADKAHIQGDVKRVYLLLITQWLQYTRHLQDTYPYLFSLALRTNPFNPEASPVVD
ncbi:MAG: two pore domain potassium channel family protein [Methanomicrobiaceae archaeon]|nr:two pore domain potassium channel family protein [Methanomicrobiaceae archaeon]